MQYHFVPLARTADLMHVLHDAGLTVREACYNTVRNITTCVWSGIARDEVFDVRPYAQKLAYAMLRKDLTQNLPRKFKIAFDGCSHKDCIAGTINDLGIRAVVRDGKRGFRIVVGGGLGPLPVEAQLLDEFLPEERLVNRVEAVVRVFNKHGNRQNRNTARIKFLVRSRGIAWVKEQIEKEYADILANGGIAWPEWIPEGFGGYQSNPQPLGNGALLPGRESGKLGRCRIRCPGSQPTSSSSARPATPLPSSRWTRATSPRINSAASRDLASTAGDGTVRVTIDQNLLLTFIPLARLPQVYAALQELNLAESGAGQIDDVVTCPGAYSCNLALTKTMNLGAALQEAVREYDDPRVKATAHQSQRLPQFVRPALDRRRRLLRQRPQDRRQGSPVLPDAPRRRIRRGGRRAVRARHPIGSRAAGAGCAQARARSFHCESRMMANRSASTSCATKWRPSAR